MALKYPLVSNQSTLTIEELPAGDELVLDNLTVPGNANVGNLNATNVAGTLTTNAQPNVTSVGTLSLLAVTGNITGGNINFGSGNVSGTGNVYASNFIGNITGNIIGNIDAAGSNTQVQFNDTGDILGASAGFTFTKTSNAVVITGNVTGGNLITAGQVSATGNVSGGNLNVTGNITGSYFFGNGSQLSGIDATSIQNGTANVRTFLNGNVTVSSAGTANVLTVTATGANITGTLNATGNVSANYYTGNGSQLTGISPTSITNGNSNVAINSADGNVTVGINGQANTAIISTGAIFVNGVFSSAKTVSANIQIPANTNSMIVGSQVIDTGYTMTIPDSSTVYVLA